jgi:hypothetical protein
MKEKGQGLAEKKVESGFWMKLDLLEISWVS